MTLKVMLDLPIVWPPKLKPLSCPATASDRSSDRRLGEQSQRGNGRRIQTGRTHSNSPRWWPLVHSTPLFTMAFGRSLRQEQLRCMTEEFLNEDVSAYLGAEFAQMYPSQFLAAKPRPTLHLYHLVGALDSLTDVDISHASERRLSRNSRGVAEDGWHQSPEDQTGRQ